MQTVIGVRFKKTGKVYYFDPINIDFELNDGVIVETARGVEFGTVAIANKEVEDDQIVQPLKPVIRKATDADLNIVLENNKMKPDAIKQAREKIAKHELNMKLVDAEYTFDRNKIIFYFTAEGRIDFRELVKDLASIFRVRIELRQIYERDDTKMRGGLAPCGRPCCCASHLPEFEKVSVKMAKIQGLSLNPTKISGLCGRLMCCLKYENDYYEKTAHKMPNIGAEAITVDGKGTVENISILKQEAQIRVQLEDGSFDVRSYHVEDIKFTKCVDCKNVDKLAGEVELESDELEELKKLEKEEEPTSEEEKPQKNFNKKHFKPNNNRKN